ncbi:tRNA-splicing endonuclease subunit Sen34-like [Ornithodoros turicata]
MGTTDPVVVTIYKPVKLFLQKGRILVWNADDANTLRMKHRIVGFQIGCLSQRPFQNGCLGMPMLLMKEEAYVLLQKGIARLLRNTKLLRLPDDGDREYIRKYQDDIYQEQCQVLMERRREDIMRHADSIVAGKLAKLKGESRKKRKKAQRQAMGTDKAENFTQVFDHVGPTVKTEETEIDKETIIQKELEKVKVPPRDLTCTPILNECPLTKESDLESVSLNYPSTQRETIRCKVFQDLWEKGHYLSCAAKFGGDFLLYCGNPLRYHAYGIVVCVESQQEFTGLDAVSWGRLGNSVHKTVVLATVEDGAVVYLSIRWAGEQGH